MVTLYHETINERSNCGDSLNEFFAVLLNFDLNAFFISNQCDTQVLTSISLLFDLGTLQNGWEATFFSNDDANCNLYLAISNGLI